jgi:hypothetical protein
LNKINKIKLNDSQKNITKFIGWQYLNIDLAIQTINDSRADLGPKKGELDALESEGLTSSICRVDDILAAWG